MTWPRSHSQKQAEHLVPTLFLSIAQSRDTEESREIWRLRSGEAKRIEDRDKEGNRNDQRETERKSNDGEVRYQKIETIAPFSPLCLDYSFGLNSSLWGSGSSPRPAASQRGTGHPDILLTVAFLNDLH